MQKHYKSIIAILCIIASLVASAQVCGQSDSEFLIGVWSDGKGKIELLPDGQGFVTPPGDPPRKIKYKVEQSTVRLIFGGGEMSLKISEGRLVAAEGNIFTKQPVKK